jgi:hypothetical protein
MAKLSEHFNSALSHSELRLIWNCLFESAPNRAFGLAFLLTSLPSALPVPAAGYSTVFGILILILAGQMLAGRKTPWIPEWALKKQLSLHLRSGIKSFLGRVFHYSELFVKPRFHVLGGKVMVWSSGITIALMAILMIIPIPGTNTLPAMIIFLTGLALSEEDGLLLLISILVGFVAALIYFTLLSVIFYYGLSSLTEAWISIKNFTN